MDKKQITEYIQENEKYNTENEICFICFQLKNFILHIEEYIVCPMCYRESYIRHEILKPLLRKLTYDK